MVLGAVAAVSAELSQVQSVYVLPMSRGMDQYLANQLSSGKVYQVVTDPKRADAVLTDMVGANLEDKLNELYPGEPAKSEEGDVKGDVAPLRRAVFGRSKGTIFLVDVKTRTVLWSLFDSGNNTTPSGLNKTAGRIVSELKKAIKGK